MTHSPGRSTSASFGRIADKEPPEGPDFVRIQQSAEFRELRSRLRRFVFPMTLLFFAWYLGYVVLAAYATGFMSQKVLGTVNVGLLLGVLQFVSTMAITFAYRRFARRRIDPRVQALRAAQP